MGKDIDYILIENSVKKALRDIQDNPKRTIRNLVDYGLEFAKGGFQKQSLLSGYWQMKIAVIMI